MPFSSEQSCLLQESKSKPYSLAPRPWLRAASGDSVGLGSGSWIFWAGHPSALPGRMTPLGAPYHPSSKSSYLKSVIGVTEVLPHCAL